MATGDDIQMPWGSWGIGVSRERRKDGIWFKVRLCLYRRSHFLGRFEDPFIARLAYDAAISQLRPGSRTNYDRRFFELTDAAALDKVQVFVLKTEQQYGKSNVAQLLQLNASLMLHSGNSCAFGEVCAWMSQARLALEADPGTDSRGQQQGSKGAVELLRQLMMVFSQSIGAGGSGSSSGTYGAGVLAARPAVKALVDSLLAALASLGQLLAACGAAPCSSISEEVVAGWLAGLQQLAARGSAADVSVLQLCSALAAEPYAGL
ncbi:hypothetical protein OEZ85_000069 [Tetradesmus obliquus]|uniref:AP2/ERF domain-containing protein n=1 Tax=Tetradesmus obliquus TaxID=3088 RepID=A0ABY8UP12_TETOB|nr:hypothetical protein OEZ85_000069 [Tetradesmus obliquus]